MSTDRIRNYFDECRNGARILCSGAFWPASTLSLLAFRGRRLGLVLGNRRRRGMTEKRSDEMRALADCCERSGGFCGNGLYGEIERLRGALADAQYRLAAVDRVVDYYSDDAALTSRLRVALKNRAPRPVAAQLSSAEPGEQR